MKTHKMAVALRSFDGVKHHGRKILFLSDVNTLRGVFSFRLIYFFLHYVDSRNSGAFSDGNNNAKMATRRSRGEFFFIIRGLYLPTFLSRFSVSFSITLQSRFSAVASFWWTFCSPSKLKGQVLYSERCFVERRENFLWELVNQSNVFVFIASNMKMPKRTLKFIHKPALQANTFFNRLATVTTMIWITCYWKKLCNWLTSKTWM